MLQCITVCCKASQCVAICRLDSAVVHVRVAVTCRTMNCEKPSVERATFANVCCSVLHHVAACCSVLQ